MYDLITIGDSTLDIFVVIDEATVQCDLQKDKCLLCLNYADKIPIKQTHYSMGGNAANVAVGCQKLGLKTAIVTELGDDINGLAVKEELEKSKVNTRMLKTHKNKETRYAVILNHQGERTILSYHAERDYTLPKLPQTKWIYYTSLGKSFEKLQKKLESRLKKNPTVRLAFNPGSYQMKKGIKKVRSLLPKVELLFVNVDEARQIAGKKLPIKKLFKRLHKLGVMNAVITAGTKGSYASDGEKTYFLPASKKKAVAKTGAGDAYASGFLSAFFYDLPIRQAMKWGTANASGVISQFGAQKGLLNKKEIK